LRNSTARQASIDQHLRGMSIKAQLKKLMADARLPGREG
jgi:hypothetical protein